MAARAVSSGTISFGLVSIPVKLYVATSAQSVSFHQLHDVCGSRIKQQLFCPTCERVVERAELVKGYEYAKNQYVRFSADEMKSMQAEKTSSLDIVEFVPLPSVDLVYVEKSYYLGPDKGGEKAYRLLSDAMERTSKVAVGRFWTHGKEQLVVVRPYRQGLLLHYVHYADEVRAFEDVPIAEQVSYREGELDLAEKLIDQLTTGGFDATKYRDEYRDRVQAAVDRKVEGQEVTVPPEAPPAKVIDLFEALRASLEGVGTEATPEASKKAEAKERPAASASKKGALKPPAKARPTREKNEAPRRRGSSA